MAYIGTKVKTVQVPEPIRAPSFVPSKSPAEQPQQQPELVPARKSDG